MDLPSSTFGREFNPTTGTKMTLSAGFRAALEDGYAVDLEQLRDLLPELDLSRWPTARTAGLA